MTENGYYKNRPDLTGLKYIFPTGLYKTCVTFDVCIIFFYQYFVPFILITLSASGTDETSQRLNIGRGKIIPQLHRMY
jgi:hypothetical protein